MNEKLIEGISFILVIRNVEDSLVIKTISSIQKNYKKTNYEIIVQDGSDVSSSFLEKEKKVKYFYETDSGIYNAMNLAILKASFTHIFFINIEDVLLSGISGFDSSTKDKIQYFDFYRDSDFIRNPKKVTNFFLLRNALCHQSQIYPTKKVLENGGYNESFKVLADQELSLRLFKKGVGFVKKEGLICKTAPMGFSQINKKTRLRERAKIKKMYFSKDFMLNLMYFLTFPYFRSILLKNPIINKLRKKILYES